MFTLVGRGRQTTARGGCNVRQSMLQNFDEIRNVRYQMSTFKMTDSAGTETVEEAEKRRKDTPTQPEREHSAIEVSQKSPCGAISLGRRPSCQRNPKNFPRDQETQKFECFACAI